jgi:hypothetical protein
MAEVPAFAECARWAGRMNRASTQEMTNALVTTSGMTRKIFPKKPGTIASGMNATMFVRMLKEMGTATSRAPRIAAFPKLVPRWRYS